MRLILDSSVLIDALRDRPVTSHLRAHHEAGDDLHTTAVNIEEVVRGLLAHETERAQRLFEGLIIVRLGRQQGWQAGVWRREFARQGVTLSQADCLVAAAALSAGGRVVTGNPRHFPMPEIEVEHWPVGE